MTDRYKPPFRKISSKLTRKDVEEIRSLYYGTNLTQPELARRYGVSAAQIGRVVRGESWGDNQTAEEMRIEEAERRAGEEPLSEEQALEMQASMARLAEKLSPTVEPPPKASPEEYAENLKKLVEQARRRQAGAQPPQSQEEEEKTDGNK